MPETLQFELKSLAAETEKRLIEQLMYDEQDAQSRAMSEIGINRSDDAQPR